MATFGKASPALSTLAARAQAPNRCRALRFVPYRSGAARFRHGKSFQDRRAPMWAAPLQFDGVFAIARRDQKRPLEPSTRLGRALCAALFSSCVARDKGVT